MSFEVIFKYYDKNADTGKYDTSDSKSFKKNIGKKEEEISLDKLASLIIAQLARRDIWITDVECYEYVKRQISYKEAKDGVVLKNKKYSFNGNIISDFDDDNNVTELKPLHLTQPVTKPQQPQKKILRYEVFVEEGLPAKLMPKNITVNKKYAILSEVDSGKGMMLYKVIDDNNEERLIPSLYFSPPQNLDMEGVVEIGKPGVAYPTALPKISF